MKTLVYVIAGMVVGCASSYPPPTDHLASAMAAARAAHDSGAANFPKAALQLKLADEQIAAARQMMQKGANERADYMTLRAYNDAELARAIARENEEQNRAAQAESMAAPDARH